MNVSPGTGELAATATMGFWAFLGTVMRGNADWRNPETGKFSFRLFAVAIATALVLGEIAAYDPTDRSWTLSVAMPAGFNAGDGQAHITIEGDAVAIVPL